MNQKNQDKEFFFSPKTEIHRASWFREQARGILKPWFVTLIVIALVATLLGGTSRGAGIGSVFDVGLSDESIELIKPAMEDVVVLLKNGEIGTIFARYPFVSTISYTVGGVAIFSLLYSLLVGAAVEIGHRKIYLGVIDGETPETKGLFRFFKKGYGKAILARLFMMLIQFACSLPALLALFQVGYSVVTLAYYGLEGNADMVAQASVSVYLYSALASVLAIAATLLNIVLSLRYAYVTMILAEYPTLGTVDAFRNSASLMKGNKWRLFCLQFSFIGWRIVAGLVPYGLGNFVLMPYTQAADTVFYHEIARRNAAEETEFPSLDPNDYDPEAARW